MNTDGVDICLVNMPAACVERPSLPLGILAAILRKESITVRNVHANVLFLEHLNSAIYALLERTPPQMGLSDWMFSGALFPDYQPDPQDYLDLLVERVPQLFRKQHRKSLTVELAALRNRAPEFVENIAGKVLALNPAIVGCTSTYQQHFPSVALLKLIKEKSPRTITLLGGANCEAQMGVTTHSLFSFIDYVVSGEADDLIVPLTKGILKHGRDIPPQALQEGVFAPCNRNSGYPESHHTVRGCALERYPRATVDDLNKCPTPDYDDYFAAAAKMPRTSRAIVFSLPVEGSRGCCWGQCRFCGLNGHSDRPRAKTMEKVLSEVNSLADRYSVDRIQFVDNAVPPGFVPSLFERLKDQGSRYKMFYEVRTSLKKEGIKAMADAGAFWLQPGIESLHTQLLRTMKKGVTAWQNVQYLKWARQYGVRSIWKIMYGFPAERDEWYAEMAGLIPLLHHLEPPSGINELRYDRFSTYYNRRDEYGLELTVDEFYSHICPFTTEQLSGLLYFFEDSQMILKRKSLLFSGVKTADERPGFQQAKAAVREWQKGFYYAEHKWPVLMIIQRDPVIQIADTRQAATAPLHILSKTESDVYDACDEGRTMQELLNLLSAKGHSEKSINSAVERLTSDNLMITIDDRLLALAVYAPARAMPKLTDCPNGWLNEMPNIDA